MTFVRSEVEQDGHVEFFVFHEQDIAYIGVHTPYNVLVCCDREVYNAQACSEKQLGFSALTSSAMKHVYYQLVYFEKGQVESELHHKYIVRRTGLHYVLWVNCNESHAGLTDISGSVVYENPTGFLGGSTINFIPFYLTLSGCYALLLGVWIAFLMIRKEQVILIHHGITLLLIVGMLAGLARASELDGQNETGVLCAPCTVTAVFFATLHSTMLRAFALFVALGLSIVLPWWGLDTPRQRYAAIILTVGYFLVAGSQNGVASFAEADSSGRKPVFLLLPLNIINSCFFVWIFLELVRTIHMIRDEGHRDKFKQYVAHLLFLLSITGLALFFYIVQLLVQWRNATDTTWKFAWAFDASWDVMIYIVMLVLCVLWWPRPFVLGLSYREMQPFEWRQRREDNQDPVVQDQQQQQEDEEDQVLEEQEIIDEFQNDNELTNLNNNNNNNNNNN